MLYYTSELKDYRIDATDGEMGKVKDILFDDNNWAIRYAIIDTRKWLPGRSVYLSPTSFVTLNELEHLVEVKYDKETIRNSPSIPENQVLTQDMEFTLTGYYGWSRYWMGNMLWGVQDRPLTPLPDHAMDKSEFQDEMNLNESKLYELRSEDEALGMRVHADDGKIGEVSDMIFDDEYWKIRYIVVRVVELPAENYYLIKAEDIQSADWLENDLYIDYTVERFKQLQSFETKKDVMKNL